MILLGKRIAAFACDRTHKPAKAEGYILDIAAAKLRSAFERKAKAIAEGKLPEHTSEVGLRILSTLQRGETEIDLIAHHPAIHQLVKDAEARGVDVDLEYRSGAGTPSIFATYRKAQPILSI